MLKKAVYTAVRGIVFLLATVTATVLVLAISSTIITMLKWLTKSDWAAVLVLLLFSTVAWWIWTSRRRRAIPGNNEGVPLAFRMLTGLLMILAIALGWGISQSRLSPLLAVTCLRPLGSLAGPMLVTALEDPNGGNDTSEIFERNPEMALRQLPKLETFICENHPVAARYAIKIIASLGPRGASAVPTLIERTGFEAASYKYQGDSGFAPWYDKPPWGDDSAPAALVKIGPSAVPAIAKALIGSKNYRERFILASVLRQFGKSSAAAVPALFVILTDPSDDPVNRECIERVLVTLEVIGPAAAEVIPTIIPWADDPAHQLNRAAIYALGGIGTESHAAVAALLRVLDRPVDSPDFEAYQRSSQTRIAFDSLERIGSIAATSIPKLVELAKRDSWKVPASIHAMSKMGPLGLQVVSSHLAGPNNAYAAAALEKIGAAAKSELPALREAFRRAAPEDRYFLAMAIDRVEGPTDEILVAMAEHLSAPSRNGKATGKTPDKTAFRDAKSDILERLEELGPLAKVTAPILTRLVSRPGDWMRIKMAEVLWKIDPVPSSVLPAIIDRLEESVRNGSGLGLRSEWLLEVDPTGEHVVPELTKIVQTANDRESAVIALTNYGKNGRPALAAVLANQKYSYSADKFLWKLSTWDYLRYSITGQIRALLLLCIISLIVECFYFRWSFRTRVAGSGSRSEVRET